jgi:ABC-type polysaccharide/polyol phosphate transport system ATPase subunit
VAAITIRDLSFSYPLLNRWARTHNGPPKKEVPVFRDLSLEIPDGTRLGIVGPNGAGKTTLLKLVAGILPPSRGSIHVEGVISPLLNVRLGMEAELTGIENIRLRGAYMGLSRAHIESKIPQIVEFADIGDFIELPLNTYSAGMVARLAFSIATSFNPEILILDESIGAGDKNFSAKAAERLRQFVDRSNILLLATHNEKLISDMCNWIFDVKTFEMKPL